MKWRRRTTHTRAEWSLAVDQDVSYAHTIGGDIELVWDPDWVFTDAAGHEHSKIDLDVSGRVGSRSSLRKVEDESQWADDGDGRSDELTQSHWECVDCGEHIEPGRKRVYVGPIAIAGPVQATLTYTAMGVRSTFSLSAGELASLRLGTGNERTAEGATAVIERFVSQREPDRRESL